MSRASNELVKKITGGHIHDQSRFMQDIKDEIIAKVSLQVEQDIKADLEKQILQLIQTSIVVSVETGETK